MSNTEAAAVPAAHQTGKWKMVNIEIVNYAVPLGRDAKYGYIDAKCESFPDFVQVHIYKYGLRQIINDAIADKTDDDGNELPLSEIQSRAMKRYDNLVAGELRKSAESVDPVVREASKLVRAEITKLVKETAQYKSIEPEKGVDRVLAALKMRNGASYEWADASKMYMGDEKRAKLIMTRAAAIVKNRKSNADDNEIAGI
jgi:hypothetical protein